MIALVLQLSDIHIKLPDDPPLKRVQAIIDAGKSLCTGADVVVCVFNGDLTFSGSEEQFLLAIEFVEAIRNGLKDEVPKTVPVLVISTPGNHDCDFTEASAARDVLLKAVQNDPSNLSDSSFVEILTAPLARYFQFADSVCPPAVGNRPFDPRLVTEYRVQIENDSLEFVCVNTAILSELHEKPGTLLFPVDALPTEKGAADAVVAVLHHPYNWMAPNCARDLRKQIESIADFVFTGHEHVIDRRNTTTTTANNTMLEAGVLYERGNPDQSAFHAIVINTSEKKQRVIPFILTGGRYHSPTANTPEQFHLWEEFSPNAARVNETFRIKPQFRQFLEDPQLTLSHRVKGTLQLSDIYVYPDLKRVNLRGEKNLDFQRVRIPRKEQQLLG
jgi:hypothetical protein